MDESTVPRWQRVWAQLPREVRGQLVNLVVVGLVAGSILLVYATTLLFMGGARVVEWLRACSLSSAIPDDPAQMITDLADAIERGEPFNG